MTRSTTPTTLFSRVHDEIRTRRQQRAERRALARDLRSYTTEDEINDLLGTLEADGDSEAETVRSILLVNAA